MKIRNKLEDYTQTESITYEVQANLDPPSASGALPEYISWQGSAPTN